MPKTISPNMAIGEVLHLWKIKEYDSYARGYLWYTIVAVFGLAFVGYGIYTDNFLFAFVIVLFGIILFLQAKQKSPEIQCAITEMGVLVGDKFYHYSELDEFFIVYEPPQVKNLYFETKDMYRPKIILPLDETDPIEIRSSLREFLPENPDKEEETISEVLRRGWKLH